MAPGSAPARMVPADGDAFLISRMNDAPGLAIAAARLRLVGTARSRNASSDTLSNRLASSCFFAAAIAPSTPAGSGIGRVDEVTQHPARFAEADRVAGQTDALAQVGGLTGGH